MGIKHKLCQRDREEKREEEEDSEYHLTWDPKSPLNTLFLLVGSSVVPFSSEKQHTST